MGVPLRVRLYAASRCRSQFHNAGNINGSGLFASILHALRTFIRLIICKKISDVRIRLFDCQINSTWKKMC
jgi:hypothetical protein